MKSAAVPSLSIVLPTHDRPDALEAVLWALSEQSDRRFEVVVAADGLEVETAATVERWRDRGVGDSLRYVHQEREGFRLARVRNLGSLAAQGEYLVFLDADCIPRRHFVAALRQSAVPGWFVGLRRVRLSEQFTERVLARGLAVHRWPTPRLLQHAGWRRPKGWRGVEGWRGLVSPNRQRPWRPDLPDFVPHYGGWGFGLGLSRADLERVNGWDGQFTGWGAEDEDLALRLRRLGLRSSWPGTRSTVLHLWHRSRRGHTEQNRLLVRETEASGRLEAVEGLRELAAELQRGSSSSVGFGGSALGSVAGAPRARRPGHLDSQRFGDDQGGDAEDDREP